MSSARWRIVATLRERETADAAVLRPEAIVTVTRNQSVVGIELVVDAGTETQVPARYDHAEALIHRIEIRIQGSDIHQLIIINLASIEVDKERCFLFDYRPTEIPTKASDLIRGATTGKRCESSGCPKLKNELPRSLSCRAGRISMRPEAWSFSAEKGF